MIAKIANYIPKPTLFKKRKFIVRKHQFDITAGIIYSLGCSLVHAAMFIAIFFVKPADMNNAKLMDN